jgi:hypothetical protein
LRQRLEEIAERARTGTLDSFAIVDRLRNERRRIARRDIRAGNNNPIDFGDVVARSCGGGLRFRWKRISIRVCPRLNHSCFRCRHLSGRLVAKKKNTGCG